MESILIASAATLRLPTEFGIRKILRNILALQQSVKSLVERDDETEFERAKEFYNLFFIGPQVCLNLPECLFMLIKMHRHYSIRSGSSKPLPLKSTSRCSIFSVV